MLVAISGSQGSGKTTVLNEIKKLGFNVVERKTARSVLADYPGKTLDDIYADPKLSTQFHETILKRKYEDEREAIFSNDMRFTERSFADVFTYACMSVGKNNAYSQWLNDFFESCKKNNSYYIQTFYIQGGKFTPVADGVRGTNVHYSTMMDKSMLAFSKQMVQGKDENSSSLYVVDDWRVAYRVEEILTCSLKAFFDATKSKVSIEDY